MRVSGYGGSRVSDGPTLDEFNAILAAASAFMAKLHPAENEPLAEDLPLILEEMEGVIERTQAVTARPPTRGD